MRLLRVPIALLLLAVALGASAGCGDSSGDDGRRARLEQSLIDASNTALDDEGAYSTAVSARCDRALGACSVGLTVGTNEAFEERFRVTLGGDGCWRAVRSGVGAAADGLEPERTAPRVLKGCLS